MNEDVFLQFVSFLSAGGFEHYLDYPLSRASSIKIGGPARLFLRPTAAGDLPLLFDWIHRCRSSWICVGNSTNVLYSDEGFDGVVVCLDKCRKYEIEGCRIRCEAGFSLTSLATVCAKNGLGDLSFLCGIPGTVGGGIRMNAGAFGGEIGNFLLSVQCLDARTGEAFTLYRDDMDLSYRHSVFATHPEWIVLSAVFETEPVPYEILSEKMKDCLEKRKASQPLEYPNLGSIFKRPPNAFAGKLIQDCGLKGQRIGGAAVSEKHAGFIVNVGDATAADVLALVELIRSRVFRQYAVSLETEIIVMENH